MGFDKALHDVVSMALTFSEFTPEEKNSHGGEPQKLETWKIMVVVSFPSLRSSSLSILPSKLVRTSPLFSPIFLKNPGARTRVTTLTTASSDASHRINYAGVELEETVDIPVGKLRLDSWVSSRIQGISRARVQSSIKSGLVSVNGRVIDKVFSVSCS